MLKELLDITILGLLVLVFACIYIKRPARRLRFWGIGWLCVLLHFFCLLSNPSAKPLQSLTEWIAFSSLVWAGISFVLSMSRPRSRSEWLISAFALAIPSGVYVALLTAGVQQSWPYYACIAIGEAAGVVVAFRLYREFHGLRQIVLFIAIPCTAWMCHAVHRGSLENAVYATLTQLFLVNALLYGHDFRRFSPGVVTSVLGLFAWAAVFPVAVALDTFLPSAAVSGEIWNVPKYFVAFGMILTLLEDEIISTQRTSESYRLLFAGNPHPMWIYDVESLAILNVNESACSKYGYSREEFLQKKLTDLRPPEDAATLIATVRSSSGMRNISPVRHLKKDGTDMLMEIASHPIRWEGKDVRFVTAQDVTERELLHHQLLHQAHHDTLTGLPNRLLLFDRMEQVLAAATRHNFKAAVLCLDLDRFKQVNDTYGHAIGDTCLRVIADKLRSRLRITDTVARTGGEEFTIVLSQISSPLDAQKVATDLLDAVSQPFEVEGYRLSMAASLGIALFPDNGESATTLWRSADEAMYRAKHSGGNQHFFVSEVLSSSATETTAIEAYMRRALEEDGFQVHYQPQYGADGSIRGFEALARLQHPQLGAIPPQRFISIAEESGLIIPLGTWVLEEVCRQMDEWQVLGFPPVKTAVNVSALQFTRTDFAADVSALLARHNFPPSLLELEITETAVMRNMEQVVRQMQALSDLGVQFSIDDFGTGYASFGYLHQLPIRTLKIDSSFVRGVAEPEGTLAIVKTIISLAHSLGIQVVAEGVEREEQREILVRSNCNSMQGFLLGAAVPASEVPYAVSWIEQYNREEHQVTVHA